jgi:hypothetical protein
MLEFLGVAAADRADLERRLADRSRMAAASAVNGLALIESTDFGRSSGL